MGEEHETEPGLLRKGMMGPRKENKEVLGFSKEL